MAMICSQSICILDEPQLAMHVVGHKYSVVVLQAALKCLNHGFESVKAITLNIQY